MDSRRLMMILILVLCLARENGKERAGEKKTTKVNPQTFKYLPPWFVDGLRYAGIIGNGLMFSTKGSCFTPK